MLKNVLLYAFIFLTFFSYAQIKLSKELKNDIVFFCSTCKKDTSLFYSYQKNDFHLSHFFLTKKNSDSSFYYTSKLLNSSNNTVAQKQYILYYLKGIILKNKKLSKPSNSNFHKALNISDSLSTISSISKIYNHIAYNYIYLKKYDSVVYYLNLWKKKHYKNRQDFTAALNFQHLGISYLHLKKLKESEVHLNHSHQINLKLQDTLSLAYSSLNLANLFYEQYKDSIAISYFKQSLAFAKKSSNLDLLKDAYRNMAVVEENREDYKKSLFYRKKFEKIKDSIWNRDKIWKLAQIDKTIAKAVYNEKLNYERQKSNIILFVAILFFVLLLGAIISIYYINKQRKLIASQKSDLEDLNKLKDDLFAMLGHDLRAPMHHLLFINKQMLKQALPNTNIDLLKKNANAVNNMHLILDNILQWILHKNNQSYFNFEHIDLKLVINHVKFNFDTLLQHKNINIEQNYSEELYAYVDINSLKVVLRNVLDNAIKFSNKCSTITIKGAIKENTSIIKIHNIHAENNKVITERKGFGLGLKLSKSFIKRNRGTIKIEKKKTETTIIITLPNKKTVNYYEESKYSYY